MRFFISGGSVSQAVRKTRRGALSRVSIKYGTVRFGSYFAVSRTPSVCRADPPSFSATRIRAETVSANGEVRGLEFSGKTFTPHLS